MQQTSGTSTSTRPGRLATALRQTSAYLARTISRPPFAGLVLVCLGSVIFEVTLFALLPVPAEKLASWPVRLVLVLSAAAPALAAVVVAVAANRKAPIADIQFPPARVPSVNPPLSRENRWRDYNN